MADYNDEYSTCAETRATLRIYHTDLDPDALTTGLGLTPTGGQRRGQIRHGVATKTGGWFLSSKGTVLSRDCKRHIDWLLDQLSGKQPLLRELRSKGYRIDISCFWASAHGHGGPALSAKTLRQLADLELDIGFDVYFWGEDGPHGPVTEQRRKRPSSHPDLTNS